jgi:hypothetical protein
MALLEEGRLVVGDVGPPGFREHLRRITGRTLAVPTLAERLREAGGFIAYSNVSPGAAYFLDPDCFAFVYHRAGSYAPGGERLAAPAALEVSHDLEGDIAMTKRFCADVIVTSSVSASVLWLANPDLTLHSHPLGSPEHRHALRTVDRCVAAVVEAVEQARRSGDDVLLLVGSDHGQETIGEAVSIEAWLRQRGLARDLDAGQIAVASQGTSALIYALPGAMPQLLSLLPGMSAEPWARRILSGAELETVGAGGAHMVLAIDLARIDRENAFGVAGQRWVCTDGEKPAAIGCGQHGGLGADETRPFLLVQHPTVAAGTIGRRSSLVDIAPTILDFLGQPHRGLDGCSLIEGAISDCTRGSP